MKKRISLIILSLIFTLSLSMSMVAFADDVAAEYYVCFSNQNYAVRNANKMTANGEGEYLLENVTLSGIVGFYVTDNRGTKYYAYDGDDMQVEETASLVYTLKFSPSKIYSEEGDWADTNAHITYAFYVPNTYSVQVGGTEKQLTYNSYHTQFDEYYLSSEYLTAGQTVEYGDETHNITADGYYRILFTDGEVSGSDTYLFDENGNYGSGDTYIYHLYIEDAPRYFLVLRSTLNALPTADTTIDGMAGYLLTRYENNIAAAEYRSGNIFIAERDFSLKYYIYEQELSGRFSLVNDDNDEDTTFSTMEVSDVGWYNLSFVDAAVYITTVAERAVGFDNYYVVGEFNSYNFTSNGLLDADARFQLLEVQTEDDDYNEDYIQYKIELTILESDLTGGDVEFYISNGDDKYKNGTEYIALSQRGRYKLLFSPEHIYGRGLNFRYTLIDESEDMEEVLIANATDFNEFAKKCQDSADYSKNKVVYLTSDIDFLGVNLEQIKSFSGTFNGGYHTLRNVTLTGENDEMGVFGTVTRDALVERLTVNLTVDSDNSYIGVVVENFGTLNAITVNGTIEGFSYVGGVVAYNGRTRIDGGTSIDSNTVYQRGVIKNCVNNANVRGELNVGGIAGFNSGEIVASTNSGGILGVVTTRNGSSLCIGGIAGYSAGRLADTKNNGSVSGGEESLYVGGIAGISTGENYFTINGGNVFGGTYVGGNVGYYGTIAQNNDDLNDYFGGITFDEFLDRYFPDNDTQIEEAENAVHILNYLLNLGNVEAKSYAGGILGYSEQANLPIRNCASTGDIECTQGSYAGGIAAYMTGGTIVSCMSAGEIKAGGLGGGQYVGGIVGYGSSVSWSQSSASLIGSDYVGGIAGYLLLGLASSYTNVVIVADESAVNVGSLLGFSTSFSSSNDNFGGLVSYNYFVGTLGGIAGTSYGINYDYAATQIDSDKLASKGMLSEFLAKEFSDEYWQGGDSDMSYPVLYYFENAEECLEYDNDRAFASLFAKHQATFSEIAETYSKVTFTVGFMEWNEDSGELYLDGVLNRDSFELIASIRLYAGETLSDIPDFVHATRENGRWVYEGDEAHYFVSFSIPESVEDNILIYANYSQISFSLRDSRGSIIVEGLFDEGTSVELLAVGDNLTIRLTRGGQEIESSDITVKYFVGDNADRYFVNIIDGTTATRAETTTAGEYISFTLSTGEYFQVIEGSVFEMPAWAWALIGAGISLAVFGIGVLTFALVKRKINKQPK